MPAVQRFVIEKVSGVVAEKTGYLVTVERFRLRFPLGVSVREATVVTPAGDTLAEVGRGQVHAALLPLLRGKVQVMDIALENTRATYRDTVSGMVLRARIEALTAGSASLDPAGKSVRLTRARIDGGEAALSIEGGSPDPAPSADTLPFDWNIDVERFEIGNFAVALDLPDDPSAADGVARAEKSPAFDYHHIRVREAGVAVRDFNFHSGDISARFEDLRLVERSDFRVTDGNGDFTMNAGGISLKDLILETGGSHLQGSVTMGSDETVPVTVEIVAQVAVDEIALFAPVPASVERFVHGRTVTLDGSVNGTLDDLTIERLAAGISPELTLSVRGALHSVTEPEHLSGSVILESRLANLDFVRELVADTALKRRIAIPRDMSLRAAADFSSEKYDIKEFTLRADTGRLEAKGRFALNAESYDADIRFTDFPLGRFLPHDSLGVVTGALTAKGRGFDPLDMEAAASLILDRLDWRASDLGRVTVDLAASGGNITGAVKSRSDLLTTDIALDVRIQRDTLPVGSVRGGTFASANEGGMRSGRDGGTGIPVSYILAARIDSTVVRLSDTLRLGDPVIINASASMAGTSAALRSGDLAIDLASSLPPDSLIGGAARTGSEIMRQLAVRRIAADTLRSALPDMTLTATAGRGNFLYEMARVRGFDFRNLTAGVSTVAGEPFHIDVVATGVTSGSLEIDTLDLHARQNGGLLDYELRLANRPNTLTDLGLLRVAGSVAGNSLTAGVLQQNSGGLSGFDFGVRVSLQDSTIRAVMAPDPVLGYERWKVGESASRARDWIEYDLDGTLRADLYLVSAGETIPEDDMADPLPPPAGQPAREIAITSASLPGIPDGALRFAARGLDLERMLDLFPTAPEIGGIVSSDISFGFHSDVDGANIIAAKGTVGAKDFEYGNRRVADVDADIDFGSDGAGRMVLDARVQLEKRNALTAKGIYTAGVMDFNVDIPAVPLSVVQGLLPDGTASLTGSLDGKVHIAGDLSRPAITGDVGFTDAKVEVGMIGTTFGISPERISIADNRITFNNFGLIAPNNRRLAASGSVNIADLDAPRVDVSIRASDFQFVDSRHVGGSQVYGTAALDALITARGALDAMNVRGDIVLDGTTDIVYILRNDTQKVRDERQHIVQFVNFADSLLMGGGDELPAVVRRGGIDILLGINIEDGLKATMSLDELNENRVELIGGGDLSFSMNRQGDTRLAGRYTMSGGTFYYKPPMIPQKIFLVSDGSYVEWAGSAANPEIHVSATQTMDVVLDYDDGASQNVAFDITVSVEGSLAGIDMKFDLAAPADIAIQDQLLAMSPEGRMQQALSLIIYNQYTGPGVSSKGMAFDARGQLNDFISKEINQWARNNLKGVDFSMGIDTHSDAMGGNQTDYSYSVSKTLFSDRVKISIGGKVSDETTSSEGFADNLLEDVTLEYRLTRRDNMFLKLYRYNTRESILEGEVTETGGGFVIRKKLNRLGDLFRRTRPKRVNSD